MDLVRKYIEENNLKKGSNGYNRKRENVYKRFWLMLYLKQYYTYDQVGKMFGLDHATVMHGVEKAKDFIDDKLFLDYTKNERELFPLGQDLEKTFEPEFEVVSLVTLQNQVNKVLNKATF